MKRADARGRACASAALANVRFLPYQPRERLAESFAAADVLRRLARAGARRLHRAEQALRDPGVRTALRRGGGGGVRSRGASPERYRSRAPGASPATPDALADAILDASRRPALRGAVAGRQRAARRPSATTGPIQVDGLRAAAPRRWPATPRAAVAPSARAQARRSTSRSPGSGLLASLPLWALIAAAIKLEDGGPGLLRPGARGTRRAALSELEVPLDGAGRRPAIRAAAGEGGRPARDAHRAAAARHGDGRAAAALEHLRAAT